MAISGQAEGVSVSPVGTTLPERDSGARSLADSGEALIVPLLRVAGLTVRYDATRDRGRGKAEWDAKPAVCEANLAIAPRETLGVVGESGSGKTTLGMALMGLLPERARVSGSVRFGGQEICGMGERELRKIRGARISAIYQEPGLALHPMLRAGEQIAEVYRAHFRVSRGEARAVAMKMAERVFRGDAARIFRAYPHELSGGQQQRVVIAQALVCRPALVIADEPTASLDGETQREILALLAELKREMNLALLLITHNIALLPRIADRVLVMYAGRIVEQGGAAEVLRTPRHPYTRMLVAFAAGQSVGGATCDAGGESESVCGCAFAKRCADRLQKCTVDEPAELLVGEAESTVAVRCFLYDD
jgi:oligopeptide/dipeptide ABC transporter ATP-binding protein